MLLICAPPPFPFSLFFCSGSLWFTALSNHQVCCSFNGILGAASFLARAKIRQSQYSNFLALETPQNSPVMYTLCSVSLFRKRHPLPYDFDRTQELISVIRRSHHEPDMFTAWLAEAYPLCIEVRFWLIIYADYLYIYSFFSKNKKKEKEKNHCSVFDILIISTSVTVCLYPWSLFLFKYGRRKIFHSDISLITS
jgi:hypothetical protein